MAAFSEDNLIKKLGDLNNSQQSIQTLSLWLIHHRKHSKAIVDIWLKELRKAGVGKKLTLLYLANDVLQNSKKKGSEFSQEFKPCLSEAFKEAFRDADDKMKGSLERLLSIWAERGVYDLEFVDRIKKSLGKQSKKYTEEALTKPRKDSGRSSKKSKSSETKSKSSEPKSKSSETKSKSSEMKSKSSETTKVNKSDGSADSGKRHLEPAASKGSDGQLTKKKKKVELTLREEIELEMQDGCDEPPMADELVKALHDLENSASSDAAVRERIAALPPEVSDASLLEKLTDTAEADALAQTVDEACELLTSYNARLADELVERKRVAKMLRSYVIAQKKALSDSEVKLQEYKSRLEKVESIHRELQSHVESLPDLSLLPDVSGGLKPLPSAGDLFS